MKIITIISKTFGTFQVKVSDVDYPRINKYKWGINKCRENKFYASRKTGVNEIPAKKMMYMHHCILPLKFGFETDHKDNDGLNNQRSNLRRVIRKQNIHNGSSRGGVSKYKGVSYDKARKKWVCSCQETHIRFDTEEDAARHYNYLAKKRYGVYAKLNRI